MFFDSLFRAYRRGGRLEGLMMIVTIGRHPLACRLEPGFHSAILGTHGPGFLLSPSQIRRPLPF